VTIRKDVSWIKLVLVHASAAHDIETRIEPIEMGAPRTSGRTLDESASSVRSARRSRIRQRADDSWSVAARSEKLIPFGARRTNRLCSVPCIDLDPPEESKL
jgi:hypothetical protein